MGSDIPDIVSQVSQYLGTPGPSHETARLATDKYLMKLRFKERGIPIPWFDMTPGFADRNYELLDLFRPQFMENGGWLEEPCGRLSSLAI